MQKLNAFALAISAALVLTACGGGSDSTSTAGTTGTGDTTDIASTASTTNPVNTDYTDYYYLQDLAAAGTTATFTDQGVGVEGRATVRGLFIKMTPGADGGVGYGFPVVLSNAVGSNTADTNLPAIAMLCKDYDDGNGSSARKSSDVLVAATATRVLKATDLAGQSFGIYREDCATVSGNSLTVDASGNATVKDASGTSAVSAAALTSYLSGSALLPVEGGAGSAALVAYSYKKGDGSTAYAVVMHGSPTTTFLTKGFVSLWSQQ